MGEPTWAYVAGPFQGFELRFAIACNDELLGRHLDDLWVGCRADVEPTVVYGLEVEFGSGAERGSHRLWVDGEVAWERRRPSIALRDLVRRINRDVIANAGDLVVIHAAGAVYEGKGVLFPGPSGSGKSTLVAALVRDGWGYLSDEAVGIDPDTLELVGYPKPISLDPGSWELLPELRPTVPAELEVYKEEQWQIAARAPVASQSAARGTLCVPLGRMPLEGRPSAGKRALLLAGSGLTLRDRPTETLAVARLLAVGQRANGNVGDERLAAVIKSVRENLNPATGGGSVIKGTTQQSEHGQCSSPAPSD